MVPALATVKLPTYSIVYSATISANTSSYSNETPLDDTDCVQNQTLPINLLNDKLKVIHFD